MCLQLKRIESEVLKNDLEVIKYGYNIGVCFRPIYKTGFLYKLDILTEKVHLEVVIDPLYGTTIEEGYHAFLMPISKDKYDYLRRMSRARGLSICVGKFIIPRGTRCYFNREENQVVAEQIIFKESICMSRNNLEST
jgi:hypothetical protein